jgi:hypothetical protein
VPLRPRAYCLTERLCGLAGAADIDSLTRADAIGSDWIRRGTHPLDSTPRRCAIAVTDVTAAAVPQGVAHKISTPVLTGVTSVDDLVAVTNLTVATALQLRRTTGIRPVKPRVVRQSRRGQPERNEREGETHRRDLTDFLEHENPRFSEPKSRLVNLTNNPEIVGRQYFDEATLWTVAGTTGALRTVIEQSLSTRRTFHRQHRPLQADAGACRDAPGTPKSFTEASADPPLMGWGDRHMSAMVSSTTQRTSSMPEPLGAAAGNDGLDTDAG